MFDLLVQEARRVTRGRLEWRVPDHADDIEALFLSMDTASPNCITQAEFERGIVRRVPKLCHSKKALRRAFKLFKMGGRLLKGFVKFGNLGGYAHLEP